MLLRLKQYIVNTQYLDHMKFCGMKWKCCYYIIIALITWYFLIPPFYEIINVTLNVHNSGGHEEEIKMYIIASGIIADFLINTLLTYLYVKGLHEFAVQRYGNTLSLNQKYNYELLDDRIHELMLEATRFAVLFIFTWISNFVIFFAIIAMAFCSQLFR